MPAAPPPTEPPVERPAAKRVGRGACARLEGDEGESWKSFLFPESGDKSVFDPFSSSYAAHCSLHGCRINKVCKTRPLGYLIAWLLDAPNHATADLHKKAKSQHGEGEAVSEENRIHARTWFKDLPGAQLWLDREGPVVNGEEEPGIVK